MGRRRPGHLRRCFGIAVIWFALPAFGAAAYYLLALIAAFTWPKTGRVRAGAGQPVSILKPIHGRDPKFYEAILSHARQDYPAYAQTNLRTGVRSDSWTINVFATNVFDRRGLLAGGLGSLPPYGFAYIQPRTAGLSIVKTF